MQLGGGNYTSAGFVTLGAAEQINDTATVTLSSGHYSGSSIFSLNGFDETIGGINLTIREMARRSRSATAQRRMPR